MSVLHCDLHDLQREPTDAELESLMKEVAVEAMEKLRKTESERLEKLRSEMATAVKNFKENQSKREALRCIN